MSQRSAVSVIYLNHSSFNGLSFLDAKFYKLIFFEYGDWFLSTLVAWTRAISGHWTTGAQSGTCMIVVPWL